MGRKPIVVDVEGKIDKKAYEVEYKPGLYFVSQCLCNPYTGERTYLVKVGKANYLKERMMAYNTTNPMMWHIDYKYFPSWSVSVLKCCEDECHFAMAKVSIPNDEIRAREWFSVDEATYLDMCERGFEWFSETMAGQLMDKFTKP